MLPPLSANESTSPLSLRLNLKKTGGVILRTRCGQTTTLKDTATLTVILPECCDAGARGRLRHENAVACNPWATCGVARAPLSADKRSGLRFHHAGFAKLPENTFGVAPSGSVPEGTTTKVHLHPEGCPNEHGRLPLMMKQHSAEHANPRVSSTHPAANGSSLPRRESSRAHRANGGIRFVVRGTPCPCRDISCQ